MGELQWSAPFEELELRDSFESGSRTIGERDVLAFCELSGDWHPQHSDSEWAASSPFGERIAHGMLVLSLAVGLVPLDPERVRALRRIGDAVFKRPLRFGESISVSGEIAGLRRVDERNGLVDVTLAIRNGDGALVCRASVQLLWSGGEGALDGVASDGRGREREA
jgi:3-hydroxybutyryl-CoA dehydratase